MTIATSDVQPFREDGDRVGGPIGAAEILYGGTMAFINATGYLVADTGSGTNRFGGVVSERYDNSAGVDGDMEAETLYVRGAFRHFDIVETLTQADLGKKVYAVDNNTLSTGSAGNSLVGVITYVDTVNNRAAVALLEDPV